MQTRGSALPVWALLCSVAFVGLLSLPGGRSAAEESWGEAKGGLRTRLVADKTTWTVGETVVIRLELRNESKAAVTYDDPQGDTREGGLTIRRDGKPVRYIAGSFQTAGGSRLISPGQTQTIDTIRVSEYWDFRTPGRYTVQFPDTDTGSMGRDSRSHRDLLPASNALELVVVAPPGGVPPLDLGGRARVYVAHLLIGSERWRALAFNCQGERWLNDGAAAAGIFSVVWPKQGLPVHEGQEVCLAVRMPECGRGDSFTVRQAVVVGSEVRIAIVRERLRNEGGLVVPYLLVDLERLLDAGAYTCKVQIRPVGKGESKIETHEFPFTVLPGQGE